MNDTQVLAIIAAIIYAGEVASNKTPGGPSECVEYAIKFLESAVKLTKEKQDQSL